MSEIYISINKKDVKKISAIIDIVSTIIFGAIYFIIGIYNIWIMGFILFYLMLFANGVFFLIIALIAFITFRLKRPKLLILSLTFQLFTTIVALIIVFYPGVFIISLISAIIVFLQTLISYIFRMILEFA